MNYYYTYGVEWTRADGSFGGAEKYAIRAVTQQEAVDKITAQEAGLLNSALPLATVTLYDGARLVVTFTLPATKGEPTK